MILEFNQLKNEDIKLFLDYLNLFSNFWSNNDIRMECNVTDNDIKNEPKLYKELFEFGVVERNGDLVVPANLPFKIVKGSYHDQHSYFEIRRNNIELEITEIDSLSLSAELSPLGEKVHKVSIDKNISMLEAIKQLEYFAEILNHSLEYLSI